MNCNKKDKVDGHNSNSLDFFSTPYTVSNSYKAANTYLLADGWFSAWFDWSVGSNYGKKTIHAVPHPAKLFMFLEREDYDVSAKGRNNFTDTKFKLNWGTYQYEAVGYHHNDYTGFNATFFDGHVKFYQMNHPPINETDGSLEVDNWR